MPLVFLAPLLSGGVGFVTGWFAGDRYGWVKWLLIAAAAFWFFKFKLGVI